MLKNKAQIISINISKGGIPKLPLAQARVNPEGLEGDGHDHEKHRALMQAICLQDIEKLEELRTQGYRLAAGTTGENITLKGLNINSLPIGARLRFANGVELELTKVRNPCYVLDSIDPQLKIDIVGRCGMYAKVLKNGTFTVGESIVTF